MFRSLVIIPIILGFAVIALLPKQVNAAEEVSFNSATLPLSDFKIRKLKAKGLDATPKAGASLSGTFYKPEGSGPYSAVVLSHDCRGVQSFQKLFAQRLAASGIAALVVDSYGARGVVDGEVCANIANWNSRDFVAGRTRDIYGAAIWLSARSDIDGTRIGAVGWDIDTTLASVAAVGVHSDYPDVRLAAVASFYPDCQRIGSGEFLSPVLIQIGAKSDWWGAKECLVMAKNAAKVGRSKVDVIVYPEAAHGFDDPAAGEGIYLEDAWNNRKNPALGATYIYHQSSAEAASIRAINFLNKHLM